MRSPTLVKPRSITARSNRRSACCAKCDASRIVRYLERILLPIEERDRRQRTQLKKTLLCYLDNKHNIARTAQLLGVHINTVRQRLGTLREITGGWDDPVAVLELHVALRLDSITSAT